MRGVRAVLCALAIAAFVAPGARADEYTKQTFLTFSGPVQLPGVTLPAGTYMFKLADPESGRRTLQVSDKDGTKVFATLLTIPNEKMEASDKPVVMFAETPAGQPQAVKAWFYPGERFGEEFVYPKDQAEQIARANHASVLAFNDQSAKSDDAAAMHSAKVGRMNESGQITEDTAEAQSASTTTAPSNSNAQPATTTADNARSATTTAPSASSAPAPSANRTQSNAPATTTADTSRATVGTTGTAATSGANANRASAQSANQNEPNAERQARTLPRTASPLELIELLSGVLLAFAAGVRLLRMQLAAHRS